METDVEKLMIFRAGNNSQLKVLVNQVSFVSQNAETPRFAAKREFIHKAAKAGDGRTSLKSASLEARSSGYLWDKE